MIDHIVLFKLKPDVSPDSVRSMCRALEDLKDRIPELLEIHVGMNFSDRGQGHDVVLSSRFRNKTDLATYVAHAEHQRVIRETVEPIRESVTVGDIEY